MVFDTNKNKVRIHLLAPGALNHFYEKKNLLVEELIPTRVSSKGKNCICKRKLPFVKRWLRVGKIEIILTIPPEYDPIKAYR